VVEASPRRALDEGLLEGEADLLVLRDVLSTAAEDEQDAIARVVERTLRPGGYLVASYRTSSGWSELLPVRLLAQLAGRHAPTSRIDQARAAMELLRAVRSGGARFFADRPGVDRVVGSMLDLAPLDFADLLLTEHLHPMTMATVSTTLDQAGCRYVGAARLDDDLTSELTPALRDLLEDVLDDRLREVLRDIGTQRKTRIDLFRRGAAVVDPDGVRTQLAALRLVPLFGPEEEAWEHALSSVAPAADHLGVDVVGPAIDRMRTGPATLQELLGTASPEASGDRADRLLRWLMSSGLAHPTVRVPDEAAHERCRLLNGAIAQGRPRTAAVLVAPVIGSAIPSTDAELEALTSGAIGRDAARSAVRRRPVLQSLGIL
jgi:hypothetical protein